MRTLSFPAFLLSLAKSLSPSRRHRLVRDAAFVTINAAPHFSLIPMKKLLLTLLACTCTLVCGPCADLDDALR